MSGQQSLRVTRVAEEAARVDETHHAPGDAFAPHGAKVPRGPRAVGRPVHGRFGKMFPRKSYEKISGDALTALLEVIDASNSTGDNSAIPAGFTYFGQFVDHDITFDPTPQSQRMVDPHGEISFRTPRLDLDSLYGSGPQDQPFLYESTDAENRGVKLLVGATQPRNGTGTLPDLPRNQEHRALIGDPRNDENVITAQLHLLFIRFHNRVVDHLREQHRLAGAELFDEARRIVCWHYQWIIVHDFLGRLVDQALLRSVLATRKTFTLKGAPFIPVEFSGAAYRYGHSQVRDSYDLNPGARGVPIFAEEDDPVGSTHLGGFRRLPRGLVIDWSFFFASGTREPQSSLRIDTDIAAPLRKLPINMGTERPSLARLNLNRASSLDVPSGQAVAKAMRVRALDAVQLQLNGVASNRLRDELLSATPLWYYVLREAKTLKGGRSLGPVGGRIVAETLVGLLASDSASYLTKEPNWRPVLKGRADGDFTMADLVRFTNDMSV